MVVWGLLSLVVTVLWVRSYWRWDNFYLNGLDSFSIDSSRGEMRFSWDTDSAKDASEFWRGTNKIGWSVSPVAHIGGMSRGLRHGGWGFAWDAYDRVHSFVVPSGQAWTRERMVVVPDWFLVIVLGLVPVMRLRSWRAERRRKLQGLCLRCGYDLRESEGRCPECGTAIRSQVF